MKLSEEDRRLGDTPTDTQQDDIILDTQDIIILDTQDNIYLFILDTQDIICSRHTRHYLF